MSIDRFVARQHERLAELQRAIDEQIKKDRGQHIKKNLRKLTEERDAIERAIFLATRRGLGSEYRQAREEGSLL